MAANKSVPSLLTITAKLYPFTLALRHTVLLIITCNGISCSRIASARHRLALLKPYRLQ